LKAAAGLIFELNTYFSSQSTNKEFIPTRGFMPVSNARILCIEDYSESCRLISQLLFTEKYDLDFTVTHSPIQALSLIAGQSFDLYIVKGRLPEMTGVELCRRIRKTDQDTPILFLSGRMRSSDCKVALAAGVNEYLVLPVELDIVTEAVKQLLNNKPVFYDAQSPTNFPASSHIH
jgi:DNA-binding response OmpR family regulator